MTSPVTVTAQTNQPDNTVSLIITGADADTMTMTVPADFASCPNAYTTLALLAPQVQQAWNAKLPHPTTV